MQNFRALGAPPPDPRASGGWGLCPQTPSLRQLGASPPDPHWPPAAGGSAPRPPKQPPPLRISGYAPEWGALFSKLVTESLFIQFLLLHIIILYTEEKLKQVLYIDLKQCRTNRYD